MRVFTGRVSVLGRTKKRIRGEMARVCMGRVRVQRRQWTARRRACLEVEAVRVFTGQVWIPCRAKKTVSGALSGGNVELVRVCMGQVWIPCKAKKRCKEENVWSLV